MKSYDYQNRQGVRSISWEEFHQMSQRLAEEIVGLDIDIIIGIARGGLYPATLISGMLQKELYPIRLTRRENDSIEFSEPVWRVDVSDIIKDKKVIIIDEITDTGETLSLAVKRAVSKSARIVTTAALFTHSWAKPKPDYFIAESDELIIFPWDQQILIDGHWQLHPELAKALDDDHQRRSKSN